MNIANSNYVTAIVRGTGANGGGLSTSTILLLDSNRTLYLDVYQNNSTDKIMNQIQFRAVRIK